MKSILLKAILVLLGSMTVACGKLETSMEDLSNDREEMCTKLRGSSLNNEIEIQAIVAGHCY